MTVPQEALDAAQESVRASYGVIGGVMAGQIRYALEAAAPIIACAERERCRRLAEREAAKCAGTIAGNALYDLAELLRNTL